MDALVRGQGAITKKLLPQPAHLRQGNGATRRAMSRWQGAILAKAKLFLLFPLKYMSEYAGMG